MGESKGGGFRLTTLDSGVRVATERLEGVRSVALGFWVAAGSRFEPEELGGVSHFIEHLLFKGSSRYSATDIAHIFDDMGADPNAATSREHTVLNARFLDSDLDTAFAVLADMLARPSMAEFEQEREVVREEVAMYEDSPPELVHDVLGEAVFGDHPLGRPVIGRHETLDRMTPAAVREYHRRRYVSGGVVVAACGNVDHERLCALAGEHLSGLPVATPAAPDGPAPATLHRGLFVTKDTEQYHVCLGGPGPCRTAEERFAVHVVDTVLGGSWSSRLFQEVRERRGLAYSVYSYTALFAETGLAAVYFGSREEAVAEAAEVVLGQLAGLADTLTEDEVARARNHLRGQLVLSMESPSARMQSLGRAVLLGLPLLTVDELLAAIEAVTYDAAREAARRYYDPQRWAIACIGPRPAPLRAAAADFEWEER